MRKLIRAAVASVVVVAVLWASGVAPAAYNLIMQGGVPVARRSTVNFLGAGVNCVDNVGLLRTDCTVAGGGVTIINAAGAPAFRKDFVGAANLTITNAEHGFNSANLQVACYNNAAPAQFFEPALVTIDSATFEIVATFVGNPTGYCVVQGGGALACGAYNITSANPAFQAAATTADIALFTLPQYGKIVGVTIKHATLFGDGAGAMTDVSVSLGNAVAPFTQFAAASSVGEVTPVSDTAFYDTVGFKSLTMGAAGGAVSTHWISTGRNFGDGAGSTFLTGGALMCWVCSMRVQ